MAGWRDENGRRWEGAAPPGAVADGQPSVRIMWTEDEFFERYGVDMYDVIELEPSLWGPDIGDRS